VSDKNSIRVLRIFVAWPSDVKAERDIAEKVIDDLNEVFKDRDCELEMVDWIKSVPPGPGNPEDRIIEETKPETWDVFLGMLWTRFGSLPKQVKTQTGKLAHSGFEAEYLRAHELWEDHGRPHIMLYRCTTPQGTDKIDADQLKLVQQFFQEIEKRYELLYQRYDSVAEFEKRLTEDLRNVINEIISPEARTPQFPHSKSFEDVAEKTGFSNRENELTNIKTVLTTKFENSIMVCAPSGMGKSRLKDQIQKVLSSNTAGNSQPHYHLIQFDCRTDPSICRSIGALERAIYESLINAPHAGAPDADFKRLISNEVFRLMGQSRRLIILLDGVELLHVDSLASIRHELLPVLHRAVKRASYFPAIIAFGRNHPLPWRGAGAVRFEPIELSAFTQPVIEEILRRKTEKLGLSYSDEIYSDWSEHILQISHGHPRCIVNLVSWLYEEKFAPPTAFDTDETFASFVIPVIEREILSEDNLAPLESVPDKIEVARLLRKILPRLCVFRLYSVAHLRLLIKRGLIPEDDVEKLETWLSRTFLIDPPRDRLWYKPHDVIRRLMADMLFRHERKAFQEINKLACSIYDDWILGKGKNAAPQQRPAQDEIQLRYIVEAIYHHALARKKGRSINELKSKLSSYLSQLRWSLSRESLLLMLVNLLSNDEELREAVNQRGKPDDYNVLLAEVELTK
jgi:hypothetical protein